MKVNQDELKDLYILFPRLSQDEVKNEYYKCRANFRNTCSILIIKMKEREEKVSYKAQLPVVGPSLSTPESRIFPYDVDMEGIEESLSPFVIRIDSDYGRDTRH